MSQPASNSPAPVPKMYTDRVENGTYDELVGKLSGLRETFLGNAIFNKHFAPSIIEWSKNQMYRGRDGDEFRCNVFGQLASSDEGSAYGAGGSFRFEGLDGRFEPIRDSTKVKDRLVLKCPTLAPPRLANMFFNQIATLNDAREFDEGIEKGDGKDPLVYEQWTKCSAPEPSNDPADMLCLNMGPKYVVPASANNKRNSNSSPPKKRLRRQDDDSDAKTPVTGNDSQKSDDSPSPSQTSSSSVSSQVGDLYEPASQMDYGGPGFQLEQAKLVQRDVRDVSGRLVHPKDYFDVLRPGSLLLVNATLHCFIMPPNDRMKRERKFYQMNAHSVRVIAPSILPADRPRHRTTTGSRRAVNAAEYSASTQAYEAFTLATVAVISPSTSAINGTATSAASTGSPGTSGRAAGVAVEDDKVKEEGEVVEDAPLEYVDDAAPASRNVNGRRGRGNANGKRGRGAVEGMDCD
ncbi:hypothetical protein FA13DRAFT_1786262 [Coprinellus micaceus]|uniref:Uncharacterized protein n=1 Tax=Coprinellus micaceus TaxID=71717 RepID=A0A4Y7TX10_COPMI|nr:hypothetical protein FA13DRAFT_1786262 [Coprinellus micaceus]